MKVLIVSVFPPDPAPEANHALHISENLAKAGLEVHVLCKKGSITSTQSDLLVHPVMEAWTWSDVPRLVQCLKECQPDVVLLLYIGWVFNHHPMITFLPTFCKKVLPGVPCVTQFEIIDTEAPRRNFWARARRKAMALRAGGKDVHWLFGTLLRDSTRIIVLSSPHRDRLVSHYPEAQEKCEILPPPPLIRLCSDPPFIARQRARHAIGAGQDDFVWIYWGYIYPGKGVETLLHAFRIACLRNTNLRLALVGGNLEIPNRNCGEYFQMVQRLPEKLGISERVAWTGSFTWDSEDGSLYLYAGDACVLPFDYGITLNNSSLSAASTHGLPVISTELRNGRDEMLDHGRNIYLVQPRDPGTLAEAIEVISENAGLRERLRDGVCELARKWHRYEAMTERLVPILESAVSGTKLPVYRPSQTMESSEKDSQKQHTSSEMNTREHSEMAEIQMNAPQLFSAVYSDERSPDETSAPCVSVIVAAHNVEKYLNQCLDSLVNQTLKNIEIVVVNDASTDNSLKIINEYESMYPNIRVLNCEFNIGLGSVRNLGLSVAKGEYIAFTDGDDWADIRMCQIMYQRAIDDNADVLIANATVFYEDSKKFGGLFDQHIRMNLDAKLRKMPFDLAGYPNILLLEPVAWTKIYKRSFLQEHAIQMENGMNSYEDICFHFSVLLKAKRISLIDDALLFYRQNRPGQISGRTNRKVFEVFDVFNKIHENLLAWHASANVWAMLVKVQVRQFDWLLKDRVQPRHKREFTASVAKQFKMIPESGFQNFVQLASSNELAKLFCMRRNCLLLYKLVTKLRLPVFPLSYVERGDWRLSGLKREIREGFDFIRRFSTSLYRSFVNKLLDLKAFKKKWHMLNNSLNHMVEATAFVSHGEKPLFAGYRIHDQVLFLSRPANSNLEDAIKRMKKDHYLSQMAVFRDGDIVVDVGAYLGVFSIYIARKFPFIQVYAFEPDPLNYACLKWNIEINELTNVTAVNKAVSGGCQKRTLYVDALDSALATIESRMASSSKRLLRTVQVESVTLEQIFQEYEIRYCRLLKMTVLGAIKESLSSFTRSGCVDLLCGEADFADCSRVQLETASWRIARQHFWRTATRNADRTVYSWIHQMPTDLERNSTHPAVSNLSSARTINMEMVN
jgi:polysaccharide biosynthesis protein PslF